MSETVWQRVARASAGADYAERYAARFRQQAARGSGDVHGEASFVAGLVPAPARILDAGCGTGRVAARLAELGHDTVGVDVDEQMLGMARREWPHLDWRQADLAILDLVERFDVVVAAGNILPLLEPDTLPQVCARLAAHLAPEGRLVCGFGLDVGHLPPGCPQLPLAEVESAMSAAGLVRLGAYATWEADPFEPGGGYLVSVHGRSAP